MGTRRKTKVSSAITAMLMGMSMVSWTFNELGDED
jgi:hypothetical protein